MSRLSRAREALRRLWHGEAASETYSREMLGKETGNGA
jgi:hypothetical protein